MNSFFTWFFLLISALCSCRRRTRIYWIHRKRNCTCWT